MRAGLRNRSGSCRGARGPYPYGERTSNLPARVYPVSGIGRWRRPDEARCVRRSDVHDDRARDLVVERLALAVPDHPEVVQDAREAGAGDEAPVGERELED